MFIQDNMYVQNFISIFLKLSNGIILQFFNKRVRLATSHVELAISSNHYSFYNVNHSSFAFIELFHVSFDIVEKFPHHITYQV
jgi:hypothetical protein